MPTSADVMTNVKTVLFSMNWTPYPPEPLYPYRLAQLADGPVATLSRPVKLKAGGTKLLKLRLPAPTGLAAGAYRLIARVDPAGAVAESNESNNDAASDGTFTVG